MSPLLVKGLVLTLVCLLCLRCLHFSEVPSALLTHEVSRSKRAAKPYEDCQGQCLIDRGWKIITTLNYETDLDKSQIAQLRGKHIMQFILILLLQITFFPHNALPSALQFKKNAFLLSHMINPSLSKSLHTSSCCKHQAIYGLKCLGGEY